MCSANIGLNIHWVTLAQYREELFEFHERNILREQQLRARLRSTISPDFSPE
jgi:hypothetical protein